MSQTGPQMDLTTPEGGDEQPTLALPTGEQCGACGAQLARDQRYCVECGVRRGKPRLPFMDGRPRQAPAPAPAAPPPRRRRPSGSAGATLVAGVGTLVLAMGVGVLIGRSGDNGGSGGRAAAPAVQVVTVAGGGGAAAATTPTTAATGTKKSAKTTAVRTVPRSKLPPPTVTLGQRGSGPGFQHGRFTGNFFGP